MGAGDGNKVTEPAVWRGLCAFMIASSRAVCGMCLSVMEGDLSTYTENQPKRVKSPCTVSPEQTQSPAKPQTGN